MRIRTKQLEPGADGQVLGMSSGVPTWGNFATSGWSGQSGWSGTSGWSGISGWSGRSGWSGQVGQSGWSGWSGQALNPLVIVSRHNAAQATSTSFADINFNTDVISNGSDVTHNPSGTPVPNDRFTVAVSGYYHFDVSLSFDIGATNFRLAMQARVDDTTVIPGSEHEMGTDLVSNGNTLSHSFVASLSAGSFVTIQALAGTAGNWKADGVCVSITRLGGAKGDSGWSGISGWSGTYSGYSGYSGWSGLSGWSGVATFGNNSQYASSDGLSTTTVATFQTKISLTTPTLTGTFWVEAVADVGNQTSNSTTSVQFRNTTDNVVLASNLVRTQVASYFHSFSTFFEITLSAASKSFAIEYAAVSGSAAIQNARIRIYRKS